MSDISVGQKVKFAVEQEVDGEKEVNVLPATITNIHDGGAVDLEVELDDSGNKMNATEVNENTGEEVVAGKFQVLPAEGTGGPAALAAGVAGAGTPGEAA